MFVDDIPFEDLPSFKDKDKLETDDIVNRLKNGPVINPSKKEEEEEEEAGEEEEEEEENDEEEKQEEEPANEEEEDEEEAEFFSNRGDAADDDDNWLDFGAISLQPAAETVSEQGAPSAEAPKTLSEEEVKKKRVEEYTAGLVDLNFF